MPDEIKSPPDEPIPADPQHQPLDRCPVCCYSLRGLPAAYRCPECGFEYDEHTRVWRPKRISALRGLWLPIFLIVDVAILLSSGVLSPMMKLYMVTGGAFVVAVFVVPLCSNWRSLPFVAVTPQGIVYRWFFHTRTTEWPLVERGGRFDDGRCYVRNGIWVIAYGNLLPDKESFAPFRRAVNDGKARYNPAPKSESHVPAATVTIEPSTISNERSHTDAG